MKFGKLFKKIMMVVLVCLFTLTIVGCDETPDEETKKVEVTLSVSAETIKMGESASLTVEVKNAKDASYTWEISSNEIVAINENTLTVIKNVTEDTQVTITARSVEDKAVSASKTITVLAPVVTEKVTVAVAASAETIKKGESVTLTVTVENATDKSYTWTVSDETLVAIDDNTLTVLKDIKLDKIVTVTATSVADPTVSASKNIKVVAPKIDGQVGELTSAMLAEIGNASITVNGTLTDYYTDFKQSSNNSKNDYSMTVEMEEGAWNGKWNVKNDIENVMVDCYRKSSIDGVKDQYGNVGHALERLYIDKDNKVASKIEKDYLSRPSIWESQHLWNHLSNLQINKFVYDAENEVYEYKANLSDIDDLYLLTYLSYSLTPLLEDTLVKVYLKVEDGEIVGLLGQTEILYYGEDTEEDPDAMSYTTINLTFSNIGTTTVQDPEPYDAPEFVEKLQAAITNMQNAKNYTFMTTDVTTIAPSPDSGDYVVESTTSSSVKARLYPIRTLILSKVQNNNSSVGTVGCFGQITEDAVLFADTMKYSYTMDGKAYHTEYSGYKQNDDNTFDMFAYNSTLKTLAGTKKINGNISDVLPSFEFSPNVFSFSGSSTKNGKTLYKYTLNESAITRDLALEVSCYKYADDATASSTSRFSITVDGDGNLVETVYPYSLVSGTYVGYCKTTYSNIGTTELEADLFDGYVPREVKTSWDEYTVKYYTPTFSSQDSRDEIGSVVFEATYGESKKDIPAPQLFLDIFGDNINGPFFDDVTKGTDSDGNTIHSGYVSITTVSSEVDENGKMTNYNELMAELEEALLKEGFTKSVANCDTSGGENGLLNRYLCYIKNDIQIVIENNYSKYLWIYFYKTGDWTLKR